MQPTNLDGVPYNLEVGPVALTLAAGSNVSYNDNINLANDGKESDLIVSPTLSLDAFWQVTDKNALTFNVDFGYQHYLTHSQYDSFIVAPGSTTQFSLYIEDFKITVGDKFSYQSDPTQVAQLSNQPQLERFLNDAGVNVTWDLSEMVASLGYDHTTFLVFQPLYKYLNYEADSLSPKLSFELNPTLAAGLEASAAAIQYTEDYQNNYVEFTGGPFVNMKISNYLSANFEAGGVFADFATGGLNDDSQNIRSYYFSGGLTHQVDPYITEALTFGREYLPGLTSNYTKRYYVEYSPSWKATPNLTITPRIWWENLDDSDSLVREKANRYEAGISVGYALTEHTKCNFDYQYLVKSSDQNVLSYRQNQLTLGLTYAF